MRLVFTTFVLHAAFATALGRSLQIPNGRATELLGDATVEIIDQFVAHGATHINIFAATINQENEHDQTDAIDYVLKKMGGSTPFHLLKISRTVFKRFSIQNTGNSHLFFVDSFNSFGRISEAIIRRVPQNEEYFLIVFTGGRIWNEIENEAERIFGFLWSGKNGNVHLLASVDIDDDMVAKLYTFFPYNEKSCGKAKPVIVNEYRKDGFVSELNVFVKKYRNMHQCPLNVVVFASLGFISLDSNRNPTGIEGNIIKYIAKAMNFRMNIKSGLKIGPLSRYADKTFSNGSADIAIGSLIYMGIKKYYLVTYPHLYDPVGFLKPIGVPYTAFQKLLLPFFTEVWAWLLAAFVVVSIAYYLIFGLSFFDQINIVMGGALGRMPSATRARSLIAMWMFATLILRNAYQGALFDILQAQIRYQPIETIEDVARFNYSIYCTPEQNERIQSYYPHLKLQFNAEIPDMTQAFTSLNASFRGVSFLNEYSAAFLNKYVNNKEKSFDMLKDKLPAMAYAMYVRRDLSLLAELNFHVQNLVSSGIPEYWKDEELKQKIIPKQKVPEKLTLSQLEGILYICAALYAISILVFVFELILWKIQQ